MCGCVCVDMQSCVGVCVGRWGQVEWVCGGRLGCVCVCVCVCVTVMIAFGPVVLFHLSLPLCLSLFLTVSLSFSFSWGCCEVSDTLCCCCCFLPQVVSCHAFVCSLLLL